MKTILPLPLHNQYRKLLWRVEKDNYLASRIHDVNPTHFQLEKNKVKS